jgi:hypothetical protein
MLATYVIWNNMQPFLRIKINFSMLSVCCLRIGVFMQAGANASLTAPPASKWWK